MQENYIYGKINTVFWRLCLLLYTVQLKMCDKEGKKNVSTITFAKK